MHGMWSLHGKLSHKQGAAQFLSTADDQTGADGSGRNGPAWPGVVGVPDLFAVQFAGVPCRSTSPNLPVITGSLPGVREILRSSAITALCRQSLPCKPGTSSSSVPRGPMKSGKFQASGDYFYFVGCAPYFDTALKYGSTSLETSKSVLQLLNRMGIEPAMSDEERCCGHDALWSGDAGDFPETGLA